MKLISVNIGKSQTQIIGGQPEITGIYKTSTLLPIQVTTLGLEQDFICDSKNHGGPDQAVYVYGEKDYIWWSGELGQELLSGTFGENLTISDLESAVFTIGDRLTIGDVILQVSAPRIPCGTLAARMGDPRFVKKYRRAVRPGLYCRVIKPGMLQVGSEVSVEKFTGNSLTVAEMFQEYYIREKTEAMVRRQLSAPIAIRARRDMESALKQLEGL